MQRASFTRFYREYGRTLHDKVAYLSVGSSVRPAKSGLVKKIIPHHFTLIDSMASPEEQLAKLLEIKPDVITGYTTAVAFLAKEILRRGIEDIRPNLVYTGAETITDSVRHIAGKAFGTEVYDTYNSVEFGCIAWECPSRSGLYHVNDDLLYVEVVDPSGRAVPDGEFGEVLVTSLFQSTHPLIRYRLGDRASFSTEPCPCGRGLRTLARIEGRSEDMIVLPNGRLISGAVFSMRLRNNMSIMRYQVRQTAPMAFDILIVPANDSDDLELTRRLIEEDIPGCTVRFKLVDRIQPSPSGKLASILSLQDQAQVAAVG